MTSQPGSPLTYPDALRGEHVDVYTNASGSEVRVPDPYRWLEDPDAPETRAWVEAQNRVTEEVLARLPAREAYRGRLTELWNYAKSGTPWKRGARYFRQFNPGLLNQNVLEVADSPRGPWRTLLDANTLSEDGTVALMGNHISEDGERLAYSTQSGGSDWLTWRVRDVESGEDLPDRLEWSKFSGAAWHPDGSGFYYSAYSAPGEGEALTGSNRNQRLMFHRLGTEQTLDAVVMERPDQPDWGFGGSVTHDGRYLLIHVWMGTSPKNLLWVREIGSDGPFRELVSDFHAHYEVIGSDGPLLFVLTDDGAPRRRLLTWSLETGERREIVPEAGDALQEATLVPDGLLTLTLRNASHRLTLRARSGVPQREIGLPSLGSIVALSARPDSPEVFLGFTSFLHPTTPYALTLPDGTPEALAAPAVPFGADGYEVRQEFAQSRDGTRVPMFIVSRKGLGRDGANPTLLYGYGGFNISLTPAFSPSRLAWLERGGVFVYANLRGGGEYGEDWHQAGTLERKQNVFDDFISCAEHLIHTGITSPAHLGIQGAATVACWWARA